MKGKFSQRSNRAYRRGDRRRDRRRNYTLQATGRRDDRSDSRGDDRPVYTVFKTLSWLQPLPGSSDCLPFNDK